MLLAVVLLFVGMSGAFRMGAWQGYRWGAKQATSGEDARPFVPWGPGSRWGPPMYGSHWGRPMRGGHLGRFGSLLLVLLGLGALMKVFRYKAWHMHRAHGAHPHAPWGHGPHPHAPWGGGPCCRGQKTSGDSETPPTDEQVAKVQPEPDAA